MDAAKNVEIPSFENNFVKNGIKCSFDNENNEFVVQRSGDKYNPSPENNTFKKLLQFNLIENANDDNEEEEKNQEVHNLIDKLSKALSIDHNNPIIFIQYLVVLLSTFKFGSIKVPNMSLLEDEDEDDDDEKTLTKLNMSNMNEAITFIRNLRNPQGCQLVICDEDDEKRNTWYIVRNWESQEYENMGDNTDGGDLCSILLQIGGSLLMTIGVLVMKNIKKFLSKNRKKTNNDVVVKQYQPTKRK